MRGLCLFPCGEGLLIHELTSLPVLHPPLLQSTLNKCEHSTRLVVCFVYNLLASCRRTWHIINSYKDIVLISTLCLWIGSAVGWRHMNYSQHGKEGHHFEM